MATARQIRVNISPGAAKCSIVLGDKAVLSYVVFYPFADAYLFCVLAKVRKKVG